MIKGQAQPEEVSLDTETLADLVRMYYSMPMIQIARDSFLSMVLAAPFTFRIPKLGIESNADFSKLANRFWMPWQRKIFDYIHILGLVPYYKERVGDHEVPVIPDLELGTISVTVTKKHKLEYKWRWNHGYEQNEDRNMRWITGDHPPTRSGQIRSPLASLLSNYRTILVLQRSLEITAQQCAEPTHIAEYHPSAGTAKNDDLTQLVATFGEKAAGMSKARQEAARQQEIRVRTADYIRQMQAMHQANVLNSGGIPAKQLLWTDLPHDVAERMDPGLSTRMFPMRPDFKYVAPQKPTIVDDYLKHLADFDRKAAAIMQFSLELIQPTGSARTQNIQGAERFQNEHAKYWLNFLTTKTQDALIDCYRRQFEQTFEDAKQWRINNRAHGDPAAIAELYPELDVEVEMECTPFVQYEELKEMWMDGILDKEDLADHAYHMRSLPLDKKRVRTWPDQYPKELLTTNKKPKTKKL